MTRIQLRRGTATQWTSVNPVLASGEMGIETDTNKFKFGDGTTAWNNLDYVITGEVITDYTELDNLPSINNITLTGNKSASDLGLQEELINGTGILISGTTISVDDSVVAMRSDIPDVSNFVTNSSLSTTLQDYQPLLDSGTNIKTINNQSLLGSGNIEIQSGGTYSEGTGIDITNGVISVDTDTVALKSDIPSLTGYATQIWVQNQGYTTNVGTVTSVNNTQPDANGNVSITIPDSTTFMDLSTNQTAYGTKTFNDLRVHQYIRNVAGKVIFYGVGSLFSMGDTTCELTLDGSRTRPEYYNGTTNSEMALLSDIPDIDNTTITKNNDDELQAIGVIDDNVQNAYNFTVVGSPTITDDGIASGFSSSNYLSGSFTAITPSKFIFRIKGVYSSTPNTANASQTIGKIKGTNSSPSIEYNPKRNQLAALRFHTNSGAIESAVLNITLNDGDIVEIEAIATSTFVTLNAKINGVHYTNTWSGNGLYCGAINGCLISNNNNWYWTGSIDLKQFSITVDGVEVYKAWQPPAIKYWTGTKAEYDAIATKDATTLYNITDDTDVTLALLELLFPVGAVYFGTMSVCPLQVLGVGTWQALPSDKVIQIAGTRGSVGTTINESLPNVKGTAQTAPGRSGYIANGALNVYTTQNATNVFAGGATATSTQYGIDFDASRSSSTYQDNAPVQQDAYLLNGWRRIA